MSIDNFIECFSESFLITKGVNDTNRCHPRFSSYKFKSNSDSNQEMRRKAFFESQKINRNKTVMKYRSLLSDSDSSDKTDENEDNCEQEMDTTCDKTVEKKSSTKKFYLNKYKNQLMLSEWLVEKAHDFQNEWYLVLCPIGKRCLVVANKGQTKAYSRTGYLMNSFPSLLPGGNRRTAKDHKENCVIDCIFSETERIFYILDVMTWNSSTFYECDTEFRFFWLESKTISEYSDIRQRTQLNPYEFHVLKHFGCSDQQIKEALRPPLQFSSQLDGLLFYHKRSHYTRGLTPLVNWLKLSMVSDILNINLDNNDMN